VKSKLINEGQERTFATIFDKDEEVASGLLRVAQEHELAGSYFTAIGAFSDVTLGFFDRQLKDYQRIRIDEQVEVLSLIGDVALSDEGPKVHAHVVVGKSDGTAHGGHLLEAHVWPTLEVILTESPGHVQRRQDEETGLALIVL
jgi:hypothetical protein